MSSTLKLAIGKEEDLVFNSSTFMISNPTASEAQFQKWVSTGMQFERYPELQGIGELVVVPASQLGAFAAQHGGSSFHVTPPGLRASYCFTALTQGRSVESAVPSSLDLCSSSIGSALIGARESGRSAYVPFGTGKNTELVIGTPLYRGGTIPTTISARQAAFIGWGGIEIDPRILLTTALEEHPNTAVTLYYQGGTSRAAFTAGQAPAGGDNSTSINLQNGWHVRVIGPTIPSGIINDAAASDLLITGLLVSLLLGALVMLLTTGRSRALQLVEERTHQLNHQALHDPLTGIPNRALILDRIDQMLARGGRQSACSAVIFLDLDDFKDINDTLGHRAGDELLIGVSERLESVLRDGDTVGRLGGDEFRLRR